MTGPVIDEPPVRRSLRASSGQLGSAALVSVAFLGTNALAYAFTVLAARMLAPAAFGELAALTSVLLVGSVPATGVQTAAALYLGGRQVRGREPDRDAGVARLHGAARSSVAAPVTALLHLTGVAGIVWLALLFVPSTLVAGYQGLLQGDERYGRLAWVNALFGAAKLAGGTAGLIVGGTPTAALAGMTVAAGLAALGGWAAAGRPGLARDVRLPAAAALRTSGALLGLVVLLNLDLLLARHHLPAAAAGEYAVGSIVTKVAFWLPQGVGVVLLPQLADDGHRRRLLPLGVAVVGAVGAVLTAGTAALGAGLLPLIGGAAYGAHLGSATWLFAVLGALLAIAQLLLYSGIAAADHRSVTAVWTAAVAECVAVEVLAATGRLSIPAIAATAAVTAAVLVATGLVRLPARAGSAERRVHRHR